MASELSFQFGEDGKYYEYIIFTDKVSEFQAGKYRYIIFINKTLIYEDKITIEEKKDI